MKQEALLDFSNFKPYTTRDELKKMPKYTYAGLHVDSPAALRWRWPMSMSTFNPPTHPGGSAAFGIPEWHSDCRPTVSFYDDKRKHQQCVKCWARDSPFVNTAELRGKVILFAFTDRKHTSLCLGSYYEYAFEAEKAGATGAVIQSPSMPTLLGPYQLPFRLTIPLFAMDATIVRTFQEMVLGTSGSPATPGSFDHIHIHMHIHIYKNDSKVRT
jgi:hypothetical protein